MRTRAYISLLTFSLCGMSVVRADLSGALASAPDASLAGVSDSTAVISAAKPLADFDPPVIPLTDNQRTGYQIRTIPAAPDSTVLCLWALGSIGAWQIARSSRNVHFSALPGWYHADAPQKIGHVTLFDLEFADMPAAAFDRPACRLQFSSISCRNRERWLPPQRYHVPTRDPRGPPSFG